MNNLIHLLEHGNDALRHAMRTAVDLDQPSCDALVDAGVPHYHAADIIKRLEEAQELQQHHWDTDARASYRALIEKSTASDTSKSHAATIHGMLPREKARQFGTKTLSDHELLALLLHTGSGNEHVLDMSQRLLDEHDGLIGLAHMDIEELLKSHGLGPAKATEITAVFEIARRIARSKRAERPQLHTPEAVIALIAADMAPLRHEELWCLPLDSHAKLIGEPRMISRGDVDGTDAGPRSIFRRALQLGATQIIVVHNHPSGDATPSEADYAVTKRIAEAGKILDMPLVDHIVIGDGDSYTSIRRSKPQLFS